MANMWLCGREREAPDAVEYCERRLLFGYEGGRARAVLRAVAAAEAGGGGEVMIGGKEEWVGFGEEGDWGGDGCDMVAAMGRCVQSFREARVGMLDGPANG